MRKQSRVQIKEEEGDNGDFTLNEDFTRFSKLSGALKSIGITRPERERVLGILHYRSRVSTAPISLAGAKLPYSLLFLLLLMPHFELCFILGM